MTTKSTPTPKPTTPLIFSPLSLNIESLSSHSPPIVRDRNSRLRVKTRPIEPPQHSVTQQQFKDECDMNNIVANAQRGIEPRYLARGVPQYGDFSDVPNLSEAYDIIRDAEEAFLNLPAQLRLELGNDPSRINELTKDQAARYGLLNAPPSPDLLAPAPTPAAGQADPVASVPSPKTPKGGSKEST